MGKRLQLLPPGRDISWVPFVWLIYLAGVPFAPYERHASALEWALTLGGMAIFLVLYFRGFWVSGTESMVIVAAMFALGAVSVSSNPGALCYFIYASCYIGWGFPRFSWQILAGYSVVLALTLVGLHIQGQTLMISLVFSALLGAVNIRQCESARANCRLRLAQEEVERLAKVAERERIARDLHDVLGHTLSVIVLKSELASKLAERDIEQATAEIRDVERIARESLAELRDALAGYRTAGIDAEFARARNVLESAGVRFACEAEPLLLTPTQESVVALAIREGITNIVRHARAHSCRLRLIHEGEDYRLEIADDGRGAGGSEGFGLLGMRERAEALGGTLVREVSNGTRLVLTLPAKA